MICEFLIKVSSRISDVSFKNTTAGYSLLKGAKTKPFSIKEPEKFNASVFSKYPLIMGNHVGIIDSSYRGNILARVKYLPHENELKTLISNLGKVILNNKHYSEVAYVDKSYESMIDDIPKLKIEAGTRLFQICSGDLEPFDFKLVDELPSTSRGSGGFGSTNK